MASTAPRLLKRTFVGAAAHHIMTRDWRRKQRRIVLTDNRKTVRSNIRNMLLSGLLRMFSNFGSRFLTELLTMWRFGNARETVMSKSGKTVNGSIIFTAIYRIVNTANYTFFMRDLWRSDRRRVSLRAVLRRWVWRTEGTVRNGRIHRSHNVG